MDHGIAAHHDVEVVALICGQAKILLAVGHIAGGILDTDDVGAVLCQTCHGCGGNGHVGLGLIVVHEHGHLRAFGDGLVVLVQLILRLADEHGGQHADGIIAAHLLHQMDQPDDAAGGDVAAAGHQLDRLAVAVGHSLHCVADRLQRLDVFFVADGIELAGGAEREQAVHAVLDQIDRHFGKGIIVHLSFLVEGGDDGRDDTVRLVHNIHSCLVIFLSADPAADGFQKKEGLISFILPGIGTSCNGHSAKTTGANLEER